MAISPKGYYINLDKRPDRKTNFEEIKQKYPLFQNVERMTAYEHSNGGYGCGMSHIIALKKCLESDDDVFLICEDDLLIMDENNLNRMTDDLNLKDDWDIITLTPRGDIMPGQEIRDLFLRINNNQTTTAYFIKKHMVSILIANLEEAIAGLNKGGNPNIYCIDQYWKRLQNQYKFYYYKDVFAGQLVGFSDIENRFVDYNDRFIKQ